MQVSQLCAQECPSHAPRSERGKEMQRCAKDTLQMLRKPLMACGGTTLRPVYVSIKLFRKKLVEELVDIKGWSLQEVPKQLIILMRELVPVRNIMKQITPECKYDYDVCYTKIELCMATIPTYRYDDDSCAECKVRLEKRKKCGGCKRVWYCGAECQKAHWQRMHKRDCPQMSGKVYDSPVVVNMTPGSPSSRVMTA